MRIGIVDDLKEDRNTLIKGINSWFTQYHSQLQLILEEYESGSAFLAANGGTISCQLLFLDICMEGKNGIETAMEIRRKNPETMLVFVTTEKEYALEAYPAHPFDYLIKPYTVARLGRVLEDAFRVLSRDSEELSIHVAYGEMKISVREIVAVVSSGHSVEYRLTQKKPVVGIITFSEAEKELTALQNFISVNRGVIINMDHILRFGNDSVVMSDETVYPLRVRGRAELLRNLTQYQVKHRMGGV